MRRLFVRQACFEPERIYLLLVYQVARRRHVMQGSTCVSIVAVLPVLSQALLSLCAVVASSASFKPFSIQLLATATVTFAPPCSHAAGLSPPGNLIHRRAQASSFFVLHMLVKLQVPIASAFFSPLLSSLLSPLFIFSPSGRNSCFFCIGLKNAAELDLLLAFGFSSAGLEGRGEGLGGNQ